MDLERAFIQLPYAFDADRLAAEVGAIEDEAWMQHPSRMSGNTAAALISLNGEDNDEFEGAMQETPHLARCPYLRQVMASFDEVLGRSRLMKLSANSEVSLHVDFNYHWYSRVRIHIPVITNPAVTFYCAEESVHMKAGDTWIFNSWCPHRVMNESDLDRVHLVIDTAGSSRFWNVIRKAMKEAATDVEMLTFDPDSNVRIRTEKYNIAPVMAPGELDALITDLVRDFEKNSENDPQLVATVKALLFDFSKDWREVWHQYGYHRDGLPFYSRLIDRVYKGLDPDRRALVIESNAVGVKPVIVQRILRSALATDKLDQFVAASKSIG